MNLSVALHAITAGQDLDAATMTEIMEAIMSGLATPAQVGGFLIGLRTKGESVTEITAAARVMRRLAQPVEASSTNLVDTCGTGGDGSHTFNISTASAFVAASAGVHIAKHGNRAVSSSSGSADVLERAGVAIELTPQQVAACIDKVGLGFMFAPMHHNAMRHASAVRKDLGVRTIFNLLGPLTNPAGAPNQVIGVYSSGLQEPLAAVSKNLGSRHVLVVHANDGLDEISVCSPTRIVELKDGEIRSQVVRPEDIGLETYPDPTELRAMTVQQSLARVQSALAGEPGPALDVVLANAGAAIYVAGIAQDLREGVAIAKAQVLSGAARNKLRDLAEFSHSFNAR